MTFYMHPRQEANFRQAALPVAGVPNFKCKKCRQAIFVFAGRKRVYQGWHCAECAQ